MTGSELVAVLCSLAGVRAGDRVAAAGEAAAVGETAAAGDALPPETSRRKDTTPGTLGRALLAMSGTPELASSAAAVVVADRAYDVPTALTLLAPGGRVVAVAADRAAAQRVAARAGLVLQHVVPAGAQVAWSAVRPPEP